MAKGPAPTKWDVVNLGLAGGLLGVLIGAVFCCVQMAMNGADLHIVRDGAIGGIVGILALGAFAVIRNRIMVAKDFR